jgi:hypothetical protein
MAKEKASLKGAYSIESVISSTHFLTMSSRPMIGKRRDWHKKLFALLKTVKSHKFACDASPKCAPPLILPFFSGVFEEPVDTEKLNVPDYFEIVKNPMCLQVSTTTPHDVFILTNRSGCEGEDRDGHI